MSLFQKEYWERQKLARRRNPQHPVIREYVLPRINEIRKTIPFDPKTTLLDVGGGNGFFSFYFDQFCDTTCIDYSQKMLELNPLRKKLLMDAQDLKFNDNSFDVVFCHALLHHVKDPLKVLQEMQRVSRGYVVILEPNRNNPLMFLFSLLVREENKALRFSLNYLQQMMKSGGLEIISSFSYGMIVPNKTPVWLVPLLKPFNTTFPGGMTNVIISKKLPSPKASEK